MKYICVCPTDEITVIKCPAIEKGGFYMVDVSPCVRNAVRGNYIRPKH